MILTGLRSTYEAAHTCASAHTDWFAAIAFGLGIVGVLYGVGMHLTMRNDRRRHEKRMSQLYGRPATTEDAVRRFG